MIPADDLTPLLDKTPTEKQPRDIYQGIPDPAQDLAGAVAALRSNMDAMLSDIGGVTGSVLTTEDLQKLTQAYDARYLGDAAGQAITRADVRSIQLQLQQAAADLGLLQNDALISQRHRSSFLNPHRTLHQQLSDTDNPDAHPQDAIGGRTGDLGTAAELEADQVLQDGAITTLQGDVSDIQDNITTLQGDTTTLQGQVSALESAVTTLQGQVSALESAVTTLQSDVSTLQSTVNDHESRILALESP